MELIDRYLYEVGRHLAPHQRADILSELRSSLEDALEARGGEGTEEADAIAILEELGPPREVAASYYPEGQYLIGPELYPLFRFTLRVTLSAVILAQVIVMLLSIFFPSGAGSLVGGVWNILGSIPLAFGAVVLVFWVLQRSEVRPEFPQQPWDPRRLSPIRDVEPVDYFEIVVDLIVTTVLLVWLSRVALAGGFGSGGEVSFLTNPVVERYFPLIALILVVGILFDVVLLWHGRWLRSTRLAKLFTNAVTIGVLGLLIQGHARWLGERGIAGLPDALTRFFEIVAADVQAAGMIVFQIALVSALIVTLIETAVQLYRLARGAPRPPGLDLGNGPQRAQGGGIGTGEQL